jgi:hypothetical protein
MARKLLKRENNTLDVNICMSQEISVDVIKEYANCDITVPADLAVAVLRLLTKADFYLALLQQLLFLSWT